MARKQETVLLDFTSEASVQTSTKPVRIDEGFRAFYVKCVTSAGGTLVVRNTRPDGTKDPIFSEALAGQAVAHLRICEFIPGGVLEAEFTPDASGDFYVALSAYGR